jgi:hypothetical protein
VFQSTRDLGFHQKPLAADGVVGVGVEDLFERDLTVQLGIHRNEDGAQPPFGMRPQHPKPLAVAGSRADAVGRRPVGVDFQIGRSVPHAGERALDVWIVDAGQAVADRTADVECREALFRVAAVVRQVVGGQGIEQSAPGLRERALLDEQVGHRLAASGGPNAKGRDKLVARDHPILQRQEAEEQVTRCIVAFGHRSGSRPGADREGGYCSPGHPSRGADRLRGHDTL